MWLDTENWGEWTPREPERDTWSICPKCGPVLLLHGETERPHYGIRYSYVVLPHDVP